MLEHDRAVFCVGQIKKKNIIPARLVLPPFLSTEIVTARVVNK
jgi:hypothetical protein